MDLSADAGWQGTSAPREVIHLLTAARDSQARLIEIGEVDDAAYLIGRAPFKDGLKEVSKVRLEKTLYAEYSRMIDYVEALRGEKTLQTLDTLAALWGLSVDETREKADELVAIGFFERRGSKNAPEYWVPFLYRDSLSMVQGSAVATVSAADPEEDD